MAHNDLHPKEVRNNTSRLGQKKTTTTNKNGVDSSTRSLRYPYALMDSNTDYLKIEIAKYEAPGLNIGALTKVSEVTDKEKNKRTEIVTSGEFSSEIQKLSTQTGTRKNRESLKSPLHTILLPIPQQISDSTSVNWDNSTLNAAEAFGVAAAGKIMGSKDLKDATANATAAVNALMDVLRTDVAGNAQVRQAITAALSGQAIGALGGNVSGSQLVSRATGQVFNPNLELLFQGVDLRTFPFTFEFFPRSAKEAGEVKKIIRTLKMSMSARKNGSSGIFISAPNVFQLTYMKGNSKHPFLNKFLPMALTGMNLSYTGSNTYSTFYDGTPTHMKMDLTFKELNPVYFEDYDELLNSGDQSVGY